MQIWSREEQAEHRRLWVEAIRSGDYKQGKNVLRDLTQDLYCCLGVACDISELGLWQQVNNLQYYNIMNENAGMWSYLPEKVRHWLGLKTNAGDLNDVGKRMLSANTLAYANDMNVDFGKIADTIEAGGLLLEGE